MSTLNMLSRQPARGLGEAGRGRAVLTGSKKKSQIGRNPSTLIQFTLGEKRIICRIDGYWPLITLIGRHFMKEGVYFPQRLWGNIS